MAGTTDIRVRKTFLHTISNSSCGKGQASITGRSQNEWHSDSLYYLSAFISLDNVLMLAEIMSKEHTGTGGGGGWGGGA